MTTGEVVAFIAGGACMWLVALVAILTGGMIRRRGR